MFYHHFKFIQPKFDAKLILIKNFFYLYLFFSLAKPNIINALNRIFNFLHLTCL